jgi:hypothetical protein
MPTPQAGLRSTKVITAKGGDAPSRDFPDPWRRGDRDVYSRNNSSVRTRRDDALAVLPISQGRELDFRRADQHLRSCRRCSSDERPPGLDLDLDNTSEFCRRAGSPPEISLCTLRRCSLKAGAACFAKMAIILNMRARAQFRCGMLFWSLLSPHRETRAR